MNEFYAKVAYSEECINALCKAQFFSFGKKIGTTGLLSSVLLMSAAVTTDGGTLVKFLLLAAGAMLLSFLRYIPTYKSKVTNQSLKGSYPVIEYFFREEEIFLVGKGTQKKLDYRAITQMWYDEKFLFLFLNKTQAYAITLSTLEPKNKEQFFDFIQEKVQLEIHKPSGLLKKIF